LTSLLLKNPSMAPKRNHEHARFVLTKLMRSWRGSGKPIGSGIANSL